MNSHKNAKLTVRSREEMVRRMRDNPAATVAAGFGVSLRTARKWMKRYREGGVASLADASSRPRCCRNRLTEMDVSEIFELRKKRLTGDAIALRLGLCRSTVFRALRRLGCSRLSSLEKKEPIRRYQWEKPGQMLHLDIKRLGKIDGVGHRKAGTRQVRRRRPGWEYLHVCVDDASRAAYTAILPDETAESAIEFLWFAVAWYASHGIRVERVLTDNGACYKSWKFRDACRELGIRHKRTRPYRPQTNGKAERFIRTALNEWAYAETYTHSWKRTANLPIWTHHYNYSRPHTALGRKPPASKLGEGEQRVDTLQIGTTGEWGFPLSHEPVVAWLNYHQAIWDVVDASKLDFVLVDGRFRVACALQLLLRTREKTPLIMVHDFTPREYYHVLLEYFDVVEEADTAVIMERKAPVSFAEVALCVQRHQFDNR